jgi:hypothetical protein
MALPWNAGAMTIKVMKFEMANVRCPVVSGAWMMLAWQFDCIKPANVNNNGLSKIPVKIT